MRVDRTEGGLSVIVEDESGTERLGRVLAAHVLPGTVLGLIGPLGAGKTRLVRAFAEALGVDPRAIASPTFVLVHEYEGVGLLIIHVDTYRLSGGDEFDALGMDDYYASGAICVIEWADRVADRLPPGHWLLSIMPVDANRRKIELNAPAALLERIKTALESGANV